MNLFGVLRLRLARETAPNSAQDDEFNYEMTSMTNSIMKMTSMTNSIMKWLRWRIQLWKWLRWRIQL